MVQASVAYWISQLESAIAQMEEAESSRLSFCEFVSLVNPRYVWSEFGLRLSDRLQEVADGRRSRLMVFVPPRHGKSELVSRLFPAYYLYRHPHKWVGVCSATASLAYTFSRVARASYRQVAELSPESSAVGQWETKAGGGLWALGVGGMATGRGYSLGIIDDPIKDPEEAFSADQRHKQRDWYDAVFYTRGEQDAAIVIVQTRWHEDDLSGWLLQKEGGDEPERWHVMSFPAIAEAEDERPRFPPSCTVEEEWRQPGEPLAPHRISLAKLQKTRSRTSAYFWNAMYQQRPVPMDGGMIKRHWVQRYGVPPAHPIRIILSWDTAYKASQLADYSVCTVWAETATGYYLIDCVRDRLEYPDLKRTALNLADKYNPAAILIEDKGSGQSLLQDLRRETIYNAIEIHPEGDKVTRMATQAAAFEAGRVWLPELATWLPELESELFRFPAAPHDDQVDSISQFLRWVSDNAYQGHWATSESQWSY